MEVLRAEIAALPRVKTSRRATTVTVATDYRLGAYGIVIEAAKARRMSVATYIRRAAYAMACHDLGVPLSDALTRDPRVARETGVAFSDPEGTRFGEWEIARLYGEEVDREHGPATA